MRFDAIPVNVTLKIKVKARVVSGAEKSPISERVCVPGRLVVVDSWSCKTSKLLFPTGSKFPELKSGSTSGDKHDKDAPVRNVNGVGRKIEPVLEQTFLIKTVGNLASLTDEEVTRFQERVTADKLAGGRINFRILRKKAQDHLVAGMPEAIDENEEPDLDYQEQVEQGTTTEDAPTIVIIHDQQLEENTIEELDEDAEIP